MSFATHNVVTPADIAKGTGAAASLKKLKASPASLVFTFRPAVVAGFGWAADDKIEVAIGDEEHHGLVRLRKSDTGTAILQRKEAGAGDGKRGGPYFQLTLGFVPMFVDRSEEKRWVLFDDIGDSWIEFVLPRWADETAPGRARSERPRLSAGLPALPPPAKPTGKEITSRMMGDPPAGRSALSQSRGGAGLTRGEARRKAEVAESAGMESVEAAEWNRKALEDNRLADLTTTFGLTKTEARYLRELMNGRLGTKEGLLRAGHDASEDVEIKIVDVVLHKLRKKLATRLVEIETVWGQGYRMKAEGIARVMVLLGNSEDQPSRDDDEAELEQLEAVGGEFGDEAA